MDKHPDCSAGGCQLTHHKGYTACRGECAAFVRGLADPLMMKPDTEFTTDDVGALKDRCATLKARLHRTESALDAYAKRCLAEPVAWLLQHDETGRDCFCSNDRFGALEQFMANNPRYNLICELRK